MLLQYMRRCVSHCETRKVDFVLKGSGLGALFSYITDFSSASPHTVISSHTNNNKANSTSLLKHLNVTNKV